MAHRWYVVHAYSGFENKVAQSIREQAGKKGLDDEITEFPVCSNDYVGRPYRYSYNVLYKKGDWLFSGLKRFDLRTGRTMRYEYGEGRYGSEPQVARAVGAKAEDDGYVISMVADMKADTSEILVLRADDIAAGPVARILLPHRISSGTHSCWADAREITSDWPGLA